MSALTSFRILGGCAIRAPRCPLPLAGARADRRITHRAGVQGHRMRLQRHSSRSGVDASLKRIGGRPRTASSSSAGTALKSAATTRSCCHRITLPNPRSTTPSALTTVPRVARRRVPQPTLPRRAPQRSDALVAGVGAITDTGGRRSTGRSWIFPRNRLGFRRQPNTAVASPFSAGHAGGLERSSRMPGMAGIRYGSERVNGRAWRILECAGRWSVPVRLGGEWTAPSSQVARDGLPKRRTRTNRGRIALDDSLRLEQRSTTGSTPFVWKGHPCVVRALRTISSKRRAHGRIWRSARVRPERRR